MDENLRIPFELAMEEFRKKWGNYYEDRIKLYETKDFSK